MFAGVHVDGGPGDGAIDLTLYADQVIAGLGIVLLAHRVEREVFDAVNHLLVPLMYVAQEYDVGIPLSKLVEEEEHLFAGEG